MTVVKLCPLRWARSSSIQTQNNWYETYVSSWTTMARPMAMMRATMPSATSPLPSDPEALHAFAASLQEALAAKERELAARDAEIYAKALHIEKLRATGAHEARSLWPFLGADRAAQAFDRRTRGRRGRAAGALGRACGSAPVQERRAAPPRSPGLAGASAARARGVRPLLSLPRMRWHRTNPARRGRARGARVRALALQGGGPRPAQAECGAAVLRHQSIPANIPGTSPTLSPERWMPLLFAKVHRVL
jgi:hypothetical protein